MSNLQEAEMQDLDQICDEVYRKTFNEVTKYLTDHKPLGHANERGESRKAVPQSIKYKHAPAGDQIEKMVAAILPPGKRDESASRQIKIEVEDNVVASIKHAVSDALISMEKRERLNGRQKACFQVTRNGATLVRLQPIAV